MLQKGDAPPASQGLSSGGAPDGAAGTVTKTLIGINIGAWVFTVLLGVLSGEITGSNIIAFISYGGITDVIRATAATPAQVYTDGVNIFLDNGIATGQEWRLITAGFMHFGILHLGLNMFALWILGLPCEQLLGRWRFLALYLLAGVGGAVAEFLFRSPGTYAAGASASVFGLLAALLFFHRDLGISLRPIIALLALNLFISFAIPGVSATGHIGGAITGAAVAGVFLLSRKRIPAGSRRTRLQTAGLVGVAVLLGIAVAVRTAQYGLL